MIAASEGLSAKNNQCSCSKPTLETATASLRDRNFQTRAWKAEIMMLQGFEVRLRRGNETEGTGGTFWGRAGWDQRGDE